MSPPGGDQIAKVIFNMSLSLDGFMKAR